MTTSTWTVNLHGNPRLYQPHDLPGWTLLGTIQSEGGTCALAWNEATEMYAGIVSGSVRSLPQRKIGDAIEVWSPDPPPTGEELVAWMETEGFLGPQGGLDHKRAARLAGVRERTWKRWIYERDAPQWLRDTLLQRWGSAP